MMEETTPADSINVEPRRVHFGRDGTLLTCTSSSGEITHAHKTIKRILTSESILTRTSSSGESIGRKSWALKTNSSSKNSTWNLITNSSSKNSTWALETNLSSKNIISNGTFLPHLDLGDITTPQDTVAEYNQESVALGKIESLQKHDFAFVLRSDGNFKYAIIADRQEDFIIFVVDTEGSTKTVPKKHWLSSIRLVNRQQVLMPRLKDSCVYSGPSDGMMSLKSALVTMDRALE